jgi:hypothetical protein
MTLRERPGFGAASPSDMAFRGVHRLGARRKTPLTD